MAEEISYGQIVCPKCGHKGSYFVSAWGTGKVTEKTGPDECEPYSANVDEEEYAECPECDYQTFHHDEFWV